MRSAAPRHANAWIRYTTAPRLYESLPDGGRRYLTDDEIDQARASAMDDVDAWCN